MKHFAVFNFHLITGLLILFVAGTAARGAPCDPLAEAFRKADKQDRMGEQVKKQIIFPIEVNSSRIGNVRCDPDNSNEPCQDAKGPDATSMLAKRYWDIILESEKAGMYKCRLVETEKLDGQNANKYELKYELGNVEFSNVGASEVDLRLFVWVSTQTGLPIAWSDSTGLPGVAKFVYGAAVKDCHCNK